MYKNDSLRDYIFIVKNLYEGNIVSLFYNGLCINNINLKVGVTQGEF